MVLFRMNGATGGLQFGIVSRCYFMKSDSSLNWFLSIKASQNSVNMCPNLKRILHSLATVIITNIYGLIFNVICSFYIFLS